nr:HEXXH motif domain-containing protein [Parafrankia discariae]
MSTFPVPAPAGGRPETPGRAGHGSSPSSPAIPRNSAGTDAPRGLPGPRRHQIAWSDFDEIANGTGSQRAFSALRTAQASKRLLLLWALVTEVRENESAAPARKSVENCFDAVVALRREHPEETEAVLLHPPVGIWLHHCLRRLRPRPAGGTRPIEDDLGYLGGVVAAMGLRAGAVVDVSTRVRAGLVTVPTYGQVRLDAPRGWARLRSGPAATLTVDTAFDHVKLRLGPPPAPASPSREGSRDQAWPEDRPDDRWRPVRVLRAGVTAGQPPVLLEDVDPFRTAGALEPAPRLTAAEFGRWRVLFEEAWGRLARDHPHRVHAVAAVLRGLVPLASSTERGAVSASSLQAFGSVLLSTPADGAGLLVSLIHEVQHSKLAALDDITPLTTRRSPAVHYSPWRLDPRPLEGLLHGAYAFVAVAAHWYERFQLGSGRGALLAAHEFVWCRESVRQAVTTLEASDVLTVAGRRLAAGIVRQLRQWQDVAVPEPAAWLGRLQATDCRLRWRLRNLVPRPELIAACARAWLTGADRPVHGLPTSEVRAGAAADSEADRVDLTRRLLAGDATNAPDRAGAAGRVGPERADFLLLTGRAEEAAAEYRTRVSRGGDTLMAWAGLALSRRGTGGPAERGYLDRPEIVRALWLAVRARAGEAPDPDVLAAWLADPGGRAAR